MDNFTEADKALVLSLVHDHIERTPGEYCSWVPPHYQVRRGAKHPRFRQALTIARVGGHWRMKALWRRTLRSLKLTCKWQEL